MSRKLVLLGIFLTVLSGLMFSTKAPGGEPPKKAAATPGPNLLDDDDNPFGPDVARPDTPKPDKPQANKPKPVEAKPTQAKPKVEIAKPKVKATKPNSPPALQGGEKAILKALRQKTTFEFVDTPLKDVVEYLSDLHHIPIRLDVSALKEAGVEDATQINCRLSGISLQSALQIMLDEIQLKWTIHHEVLMITSATKADTDESYQYTKLYDVSDLVAMPKDTELQNPLFGKAAADNSTMAQPWGVAGGMGSGVPVTYRAQGGLYDVKPIEDLITSTVATKTWPDNGGPGPISHLDGMLIVTQTRDVHMQIEDLLAQLRARRQARPTLSVELHWLWLNAKQRDRLLAGHAEPSTGQVSLTVDGKRLRQIAAEVPGFHGQVACINGLTTAVAAGDLRATIVSTIPVIGDAVGYQPIISMPNVGVAAQVRPTFVPGTKTAMLDIQSMIARWEKSRPPAIIGSAWPADRQVVAGVDSHPPFAAPAGGGVPGGFRLMPGMLPPGMPPHDVTPPGQNLPGNVPATAPSPAAPTLRTHTAPGGSASCPVDLPVLPTQQIGTTLRVPLGKPVVVGSITFAAAGDAGLSAAKEDMVEVYLIATTSIVRNAAK